MMNKIFKNFANTFRQTQSSRSGRVIDTVYVVIDKSEINKVLKAK